MKKFYHCAVNYIKEDQIADATNILLNLYENELFDFKVSKNYSRMAFNNTYM